VLRVAIGVLVETPSVGLLVGVFVAGASLAGVVPQLEEQIYISYPTPNRILHRKIQHYYLYLT